jgi:DNA-binding NtrC family response regulator
VHPLGAARPVTVDVRLVAATNRDLAAHVEAGGFRRDLYARLSLWELRVPPLRARRVDLLDWLARFVRRRQAERGLPPAPLALDADAAERVLCAPWPENLRGLDRLAHELVALGRAGVGRHDLPAWLGETRAPVPAPAAPAAARVAPPTREEFEAAMRELGGSVRALARRFARDRRQIYRWIEAWGLEHLRPRPGRDGG